MNEQSIQEVENRTLDLCRAIVSLPEFEGLFAKLSAFESDDAIGLQYQSLNQLAHLLQERQHAGLPVSDSEAEQFESLRQAFLGKTVAQDFLVAQEHVQKIQSTVFRLLTKTFEVGRVPVAEDFFGECCSSSGCGCG